MTIVLSADLGTHTGIAWDGPGDGRRAPGSYPVCSTWKAPYAEPTDFGLRFFSFYEWLDGVFAVVRPGLFTFETPLVPNSRGGRFVSTAATMRLLIGFAGVAEMVATKREVECAEINISTVKKFLAGNGRADKASMMARAKQLGWACADSHQADAAGLFAYTKAMNDPRWSFAVTALGASAAQ